MNTPEQAARRFLDGKRWREGAGDPYAEVAELIRRERNRALEEVELTARRELWGGWRASDLVCLRIRSLKSKAPRRKETA